ncbi:hypothetical protein JYU04_02595 [Dehalococcoides mccartyi]|nr:hypothetical protein [Dehalococcoides mccartyi]
MTVDNGISIASALLAGGLVAFGWYVNGVFQRRKDVAQRRLDFRLNALESFLPVFFAIGKSGGAPFTEQGFLQQLENARSKFQLYGLEDEIQLMEAFIDAIQKSNLANANDALKELVPLVRGRIRSELGIAS